MGAQEQESSYTRLAHPAVAERLKLTDQQRLKVAAILAERAEALAKGAAADRPKIIEENEKKLAELLTDEQRSLWSEKAEKPAEPKLRFNFRFQRWIDVLDWFAKQAGLSLVLDAPPPGTFNYTDEREYTPTEAIDLLNGVLMTKGYTLIRRERMLLVINLNEGIPEGMVPRVTLDELDKHGKFEIVSVLFTLNGRSATEAAAEIKPLLGPHGKAVPLPATGQILVTDSAGMMRAIDAVIQSMPPSGRGGIAGPYEVPQLVVYPVKAADPQAAVQVLKALMPNAMFVLDPKTDRINAYAGPTQQQAVKTILEEMEAGVPAEQQPHLELYPLGESGATNQLVTTLQLMVPRARLSIDAKTNKLVAWATPSDQKLLGDAITKFGGGDTPENTRQVETYRLTSVDFTSAMSLVRTLAPNATVTYNAQAHGLVVFAVPADQKIVRAAIDQLQHEAPGAEPYPMAAYPITAADPASVVRVLSNMFPNAQIVVDSRTRRLIVRASPADQAAIKQALEKMDSGVPAESQDAFMVYPAADIEPQTALRMLAELFPDMRLSSDSKAQTILAWGRKADQEALAQVLKQMQTPDAEHKPRVTVYPAGDSDPTVMALLFRTLVPNARVAADTQARTLVAWGTPKDHEAIRSALEQMAKKGPPETMATLVVYTLDAPVGTPGPAPAPAGRKGGRTAAASMGKGTTASSAITILKAMFPAAQFAPGAEPNKLIAWATPGDHVGIKKAVEEMSKPEPAETAPRIVTYTLEATTSTAAIPVLRAMFPDAQFAAGADVSKVMAFARPADHEQIKAVVAQMSEKDPPEVARKLVAYTLEVTITVPTGRGSARAAAVTNAVTALKAMFPDAQINVSSDPRRLLVWARPADHEGIKKAIEEMNKREPSETSPRPVTYTVESGSAAAVMATLKIMYTDALFLAGNDPSQIIAFARPADQDAIKAAIAELSRKEPAETARQIVTYTVDSGSAAGAMPTLRAMFPAVQFSVGTDPARLIVYARRSEHEAVKTALAQLAQKEPSETAPQVVVHTVESGSMSVVMPTLRTMFPAAQFSSGNEPGKIIAYARPADQDAIKTVLAQLTKKEPIETARKIVVYTVDIAGTATTSTNARGRTTTTTSAGGAAVVIPTLKAMFPDAQFTVGADPRRLIAWARPADHEAIKKAIDEMSKPEPAATAARIVTYTLEATTSTAALPVLRAMFPDVQFAAGADASQVVAFARPADQEQIKLAVAQMSEKDPPELARKLVTYTLEVTLTVPTGRGTARAVAVTNAITALKTMFPNAQITSGSDPRQLVVWARPIDHEGIKKAVEEMNKRESPQTAPRPVTYTVDSGSAANIMAALRVMFIDAQFLAGNDPSQIVAFARPVDQEAIKAAIAELGRKDPAETARQVVVYTVDSGAATTVLTTLRTMFPNAQLSPGSDPSKIVSWARPADQAAIKAAIDEIVKKEGPETAPTAATYTIGLAGGGGTTGRSSSSSQSSGSGAAGVIRGLKLMFPNAQFSVGADSSRLVVWARPSEHPAIKAVVEEMNKNEPPEIAPRAEVYTLTSVTATNAIPMLQAVFPNAQFSAGSDPNQVVAFARPADLEGIRRSVTQMSTPEPAATAPRLVTYVVSLGRSGSGRGASARSGAASLLVSLKLMFPDAQFAVGSDPSRLAVWARPATQEAVKKAVDELEKREPPETAPRAAVYQLDSMAIADAITMLKTAFPDAQFTAGTDPNKLVVWARPEDQEPIKAAIQQIETGGLPGSDRLLSIYPMKREDAASLSQMLDPLLKKNVLLVPDATRNRLLVWADSRHQASMKQMIEQYSKELAKAQEPTSQVYRLRIADPKAALTVLSALVPSAQIAMDASSHSLVVSAMPQDHEKIKATVAEMDRDDAGSQAPQMKVHRLVSADASSLLRILQALYRQRNDVQVSGDVKNNAIVAVASPAQQEMIHQFIEQADKGALADVGSRLELFSLKNTDPTAVLQVLNSLFDRQGTMVQLSIEPRSNQLVAIAHPEQLAQIRATVEQMRGEDRATEIYQLEVVDAGTAQGAIQRLFADNGMINGPAAPIVDLDTVGQQLFVRATKEQFGQIRDLLVKMGETSLETHTGETRFSRTVPFQGNVTTALDEIRRVWPQLRGNPIRVMPADGAAPAAAPAQQTPTKETPAKEAPAKDTKEAPAKQTPAPASKSADRDAPAARILWASQATAKDAPSAPASAAPQPAAGEPAKDSEPGRAGPIVPGRHAPAPTSASGSESTSNSAAAQPGAKEPVSGAPIVITPGDGSVTISSDDPAALDQFESLLRSYAKGGAAGKNLMVYQLHNAKATTVAETLGKLYKATPAGRRAGTAASTLVAIPDERLNSLVVQANRADRTAIDNLVRMLDSGDVPESLSANRMKLIPVKNTNAAQIEQILRNIYQGQVESFGVEEVTNSLVVTTTPAMGEEIARFVKVLDEAAGGDPSRKTLLVPLHKSSALRIQQSLNSILPSTGTKRRGSTTRSSTTTTHSATSSGTSK